MEVFKLCKRKCDCHYGVSFDQCDCVCPAWCGNEEYDYVLQEEPESFMELTEQQWKRQYLGSD